MSLLWLGLSLLSLLFIFFIGVSYQFMQRWHSPAHLKKTDLNTLSSINLSCSLNICDCTMVLSRNLVMKLTLLTVLLLALGLYIYSNFGSYVSLVLYRARYEVAISKNPDARHFIAQFEQQAQRYPHNIAVWSLLYPLYRDSQQWLKALNALQHWQRLEPNNTALLAELAQLEYHLAGDQLSPSVLQLIKKLQQLDPQQPGLLMLLGAQAFQQHHFQQAINYWQQAASQISDRATQTILMHSIQKARQSLSQHSNAYSQP